MSSGSPSLVHPRRVNIGAFTTGAPAVRLPPNQGCARADASVHLRNSARRSLPTGEKKQSSDLAYRAEWASASPAFPSSGRRTALW